jgi:WD40 repeat protein
MLRRLRIFVSSPADVADERLRAALIVDKLSQDYGRFFSIETYRWEHEAMLASKQFQDAIEPPSAFDVVLLILWSRLGTPLPEKTRDRQYKGIDGRTPVTGTEWEYEEALRAARENGSPDLLAFRNISPATIDTLNPDAQANSIAQLQGLNAFWTRHFADRGVFLAAYDEYRTLEEFARRLEESLRKLIERRIRETSVGEAQSIWLGEPFRGLESYEFEHSPVYFGRDAAVMNATEQIVGNARSGQAFLLVSGASGSGKSSLVKAGILPRLMKPQRISGMAFIRRVILRAGFGGADPVLGLAKALARVDDQDSGVPELFAPGQDAIQLSSHLRAAVNEPGYLVANAMGRLTESSRASGRLLAFENAKLILVIDQLEELFVVPGISPADRRLFVQLLAGLARSGAVWIIATLRADFWHRAAEIPELVELAAGLGRIDLAAASGAELAEIIRKPAQAAGLSFETHPQTGLGLDVVLADHAAAAPGALPLLSFTLDEIYKNAKARGETVLTYASYEELGGLEGAIAKRADEIVAALPGAAQESLPRVLRALVTVTETADRMPVARSAPLNAFGNSSPARTLIDAFVEARLLVATADVGSSPTVRLAHEALISQWKHARDQLDADRRDLKIRTLVERQFTRWSEASGGSRRQLLLRNPDLANALDLSKRWGDELDGSIRDFIRRSGRHARLAQTLTAAAAIVFAAVAAAAVYAERQALQERELAIQNAAQATAQSARADQNSAAAERSAADARTQRDSANTQRNAALSNEARRVADEAKRRLSARSTEQAAMLAIEGLGFSASADDQPTSDALQTVLYQSLQHIHDLAILPAVYSPLRHFLAHGEQNNVTIYDSENAGKVSVIDASDLTAYEFSPDEATIATGTVNGVVEIWDVKSGRKIITLAGQSKKIDRIGFYNDGRNLWTSTDDGEVRLWSSADGSLVAALAGHEAAISSIAVTADSRRVATITKDNTFRIFETRDARELTRKLLTSGDGNQQATVVLSPGGEWVLASLQNNIEVWSGDSGSEINSFSNISYSEFFGRFLRLVPVCCGGDERLFDIAANKIVAQADEDKTDVNGNDNFVLWSDRRSNTKVWNARSGELTGEIGRDEKFHWERLIPGSYFVVSYSSAAVRVWDPQRTKLICEIATGEEIVNLEVNPALPRGIVEFANRRELRDLSSCKLIRMLGGQNPESHDSRFWSFSDDGRRMTQFIYREPQTLRIWDGEAGDEIPGPTANSQVTGVKFSQNGAKMAVAQEDGTSIIWDVELGALATTLKDTSDPEFSPRGNSIHVTSEFPKGKFVTRIFGIGGDAGGLPGLYASRLRQAVMLPANQLAAIAAVKLESRQESAPEIRSSSAGELITTLKGQRSGLRQFALADNGQRAISFFNDNTARIWDPITGNLLASLHAQVLSLTGDKWLLARVDDTDLEVWNVHDAALFHRLNNVFAKGGTQIPFVSKDGEILLIWRPQVSTVWDVVEGRAALQLNSVRFARVAPEGGWVHVWFQNGTGSFLDVSSGKSLASWPKQYEGLVSSDGKFDIVFDGEYGHVCDSKSGGEISRFKTNLKSFTYAQVSPDGQHLIIKTSDDAVNVWDLNTGRNVASLTEHAGISHPYSDPSGRYLVLVDANIAMLHNLVDGSKLFEFPVNQTEISAVAFNNDGGQIAVATADGDTRAFDTSSGRLVADLKARRQRIVSVQFSSDGGRVLAKSEDQIVRLWNIGTGAEQQTFESASFDNPSVVFVPKSDRFILLRSRRFKPGSDQIKLWGSMGQFIGSVQGSDEIADFAVSPNGASILAVTKSGSVELWDMRDLRQYFISKNNEGSFSNKQTRVAFSPDSTRFAKIGDIPLGLKVEFWNADDQRIMGAKVLSFSRNHPQATFNAQFTKDGGRLVLIVKQFDQPLRLTILNSGTAEIVLEADLQNTTDGDSVIINKEGDRVLVLPRKFADKGRRAASLWSTEDASRVALLGNADTSVSAAEFSLDDRLIATNTEKGSLNLWDGLSGVHREVIGDNLGEPQGLAFSNNSKYLVLRTNDQKLRIFNLESTLPEKLGQSEKARLDLGSEANSIAVDDNGKRFLTIANKGFEVWEYRSGLTGPIGSDRFVQVAAMDPRERGTLENDLHPVFSPDGQLLLIPAQMNSISGKEADGEWFRMYSSVQELIDVAKSKLLRCLMPTERIELFLDMAPPEWCIEMGKWPYNNDEWRSWLRARKAGANLPLPEMNGQEDRKTSQ